MNINELVKLMNVSNFIHFKQKTKLLKGIENENTKELRLQILLTKLFCLVFFFKQLVSLVSGICKHS